MNNNLKEKVGLVLIGKDFKGEDLKGVNFKFSKLVNCDFTGADLTGVRFENCKIQECDFTDAKTKDAVFYNCKLKKVNFKCVLNKVRFYNCTIEETVFSKRIYVCDFVKSDIISSTSFEGANITNCKFEDTHIEHSTNFSKVTLDDVIGLEYTMFTEEDGSESSRVLYIKEVDKAFLTTEEGCSSMALKELVEFADNQELEGVANSGRLSFIAHYLSMASKNII